MLIGYEAIVDFLLQQKLVLAENIVAGDLTLINASRRNCNVRVIRDTSPHYFLKQEVREPGKANTKPATVAYEAEIYRLLGSLAGYQTIAPYLPRCHGFDAEQQVLILEGIPGSVSLASHQFNRRRAYVRLARKLGTAVAALHEATTAERARVTQVLGISLEPPWVFFLDRPDYWVYLHSSASNLEFIRIFQRSSSLCRQFERLRQGWRAESLVHGDLKWDNCLLSSATANGATPEIKIVDWELARVGDPCWDVGSIFAEYLSFWLSSIPFTGDGPPDQFLKLARFPLEMVQPAARAFWKAYVRARSVSSTEQAEQLSRATQYAAVRLVQAAYERLQGQVGITAHDIYILQFSANIIARPLQAAVQLLGLPLPKPRNAS